MKLQVVSHICVSTRDKTIGIYPTPITIGYIIGLVIISRQLVVIGFSFRPYVNG